jgi:hypothetical protein
MKKIFLICTEHQILKYAKKLGGRGSIFLKGRVFPDIGGGLF